MATTEEILAFYNGNLLLNPGAHENQGIAERLPLQVPSFSPDKPPPSVQWTRQFNIFAPSQEGLTQVEAHLRHLPDTIDLETSDFLLPVAHPDTPRPISSVQVIHTRPASVTPQLHSSHVSIHFMGKRVTVFAWSLLPLFGSLLTKPLFSSEGQTGY